MDKGASLLTDRGVIKVTGEAEAFLQKLVTNNMLDMKPGEARYAGLLSPQGKLLFDFLIVSLPEGSGYYFDCVKAQAADLAKRINFHKMRAKITVEDVSESLGVAAFWGQEAPQAAEGITFKDPRADALGSRLIAPHAVLAKLAPANEQAYENHRIAATVPKGGVDFIYGDTFVHEANFDALHGVDFKKGCYVGQEVVSRVHFRKTARKRIVKVHFDGPPPAPGSEILYGEIAIGSIGSISGSEGLVTLRLDRLEAAQAAGVPLRAGEATLNVDVPPEFVAAAAGVERLL
ncbi:MAG: folate-binding protein [Beijerinckiaceae bacterium]|nr:MAG: folate-binding protein [Beijerinckiaceae bacterium]